MRAQARARAWDRARGLGFRLWLRCLQLHEECWGRREGCDRLLRHALEQPERIASRAGHLLQRGPLSRVGAVVRLQHRQLIPCEDAVHARRRLQRHHASSRPVLEPLPRGLRRRRLARAEGERRARRPHRHAVAALHRVVARERAHRCSDSATLLYCQRAAQQPQPRLVRALNGCAQAGRRVARRAPLDAMLARRHHASLRARARELLGEEGRLRERGVDHLVAPEGEVETQARQRRQQCAARCMVRNGAAAAREATHGRSWRDRVALCLFARTSSLKKQLRKRNKFLFPCGSSSVAADFAHGEPPRVRPPADGGGGAGTARPVPVDRVRRPR